jgi:DNA-directed RNA polymerase subunit RPC12/RpoP
MKSDSRSREGREESRPNSWASHAVPGSYSLPVNDKTRLAFVCSSCSSHVPVVLKQLKRKLATGSPMTCRKCSVRDLWKRPGFREKISQEKIWSDPFLREKMSSISKGLWKDPGYVALQAASHSSPDFLSSVSKRSRIMWGSEVFRERQRSLRGHPDWVMRQSAIMRALWLDPSYREKVLSSLSSVFGDPSRVSSLEVVVMNVLRDAGIPFVHQSPLGPYLFDFFLPEHDLFLECQGEYWHSLPRAASRDASKFSYLSSVRPSSRIAYLHERDFLNPASVRDLILSRVLGLPLSLQQEDFSFSDVSISLIESRLDGRRSRPPSKVFLDSYHYAQFGRSARAVYGAHVGGVLVAVCKFSSPVRQEVATSMGLEYRQVLELDRFCIHPRYQKKNFASWLLSRCSRLLFSANPDVKSLVSFSDTTHGHRGTIYVASNWRHDGVVGPDYHYVDERGWSVHKKTLWNHASRNGMGEREYAEKNGYVRVYGREKFKFVMERPER